MTENVLNVEGQASDADCNVTTTVSSGHTGSSGGVILVIYIQVWRRPTDIFFIACEKQG